MLLRLRTGAALIANSSIRLMLAPRLGAPFARVRNEASSTPCQALRYSGSIGPGETPTSRSKRQTHEEVERYLSNLFNLERKTALVTGAGGGVGAYVCNALARAGADVVVTDLPGQMAACAKVVEGIRAVGREAIAVPADVTDQASINAAMEAAGQKFGKLDVLICNAGVLGEMQMPQDLTEDNWWESVSLSPLHSLISCKVHAAIAGATSCPSIWTGSSTRANRPTRFSRSRGTRKWSL